MKILIILDSFGSGGAQKLAVNLASGFINKNHEVHILGTMTNQIFLNLK